MIWFNERSGGTRSGSPRTVSGQAGGAREAAGEREDGRDDERRPGGGAEESKSQGGGERAERLPDEAAHSHHAGRRAAPVTRGLPHHHAVVRRLEEAHPQAGQRQAGDDAGDGAAAAQGELSVGDREAKKSGQAERPG